MSFLPLRDVVRLERAGLKKEIQRHYRIRFGQQNFETSVFDLHYEKDETEIFSSIQPYIEKFTINCCIHFCCDGCLKTAEKGIYDLLFRRSPNPMRELTIHACNCYYYGYFNFPKLINKQPRLKMDDYSNMRKLKLYCKSRHERLHAMLPYFTNLEELQVKTPLTSIDCIYLLDMPHLKKANIHCTIEQWKEKEGIAENWAATNQLTDLLIKTDDNEFAAEMIPLLTKMTNLRLFHFFANSRSCFRAEFSQLCVDLETLSLSTSDIRLFEICVQLPTLKSLRVEMEDNQIFSSEDLDDSLNSIKALKVLYGMHNFAISLIGNPAGAVGMRSLYYKLKPQMSKTGSLLLLQDLLDYKRDGYDHFLRRP